MPRQWNDSFCTMDPQVDEEHRLLFELLDRLATHRRESDVEGLNLLLDHLMEHSFVHFAHEEALMQAAIYPKVERHAEQHEVLRKALIESIRMVAKDELALPDFVQRIKAGFMAHFEADDLTFVAWQTHQQVASNN